MEELKLVIPTVDLRTEFQAMALESLGKSEEAGKEWRFEDALGDFDAYVKKFLDYAQGRNLPEGWVQDSTLWLTSGRTVLGRVSIRHRLTGPLRQRGGHIGYYIRISKRRKGYGTAILRLALEEVGKLGLKKVLVTCDDDNIASAKIIEKNGGKFQDKVKLDERDAPTRRYWIDIEGKEV